MFSQLLDNQYLKMMNKTADHLSFRHNLLSNNIANVNTPGYRRRDTADFPKVMREALAKTSFKAKTSDSRHIDFGRKDFDNVRPEMIIQEQTRFRNDKSSVDIDSEMAEFSKNGLRYQLITKRLQKYFKKYAEILEKSG